MSIQPSLLETEELELTRASNFGNFLNSDRLYNSESLLEPQGRHDLVGNSPPATSSRKDKSPTPLRYPSISVSGTESKNIDDVDGDKHRPLTLSQISPRKAKARTPSTESSEFPARAPSPMRLSEKRPASVSSDRHVQKRNKGKGKYTDSSLSSSSADSVPSPSAAPSAPVQRKNTKSVSQASGSQVRGERVRPTKNAARSVKPAHQIPAVAAKAQIDDERAQRRRRLVQTPINASASQDTKDRQFASSTSSSTSTGRIGSTLQTTQHHRVAGTARPGKTPHFVKPVSPSSP